MSTSTTYLALSQNTVEEIALKALPILETLGLRPDEGKYPSVLELIKSDKVSSKALFSPDIPLITWW